MMEGQELGMDVEDDEQLQIDLSCGSRIEAKASASGAAERHSAMTWLQAAEHVLREEGPEMHIRELTRTILELGMVKSSCSTSLETLLYRQTSKDTSKFIRVPGKMGWFGLKGEGMSSAEQKPAIVLPSQAEQRVAGVVVEGGRGEGDDWDFRPKVFYKRKRRTSECSGSESEEDSGWSSSSDEDSEALYHKRYIFTKKMAKSIIYENVALAEQLSLIEDKIATAEAERQFLLKKLMKFNQKSRQATLSAKKAAAAPSTSATDTTVKSSPALFKASGSISFTAAAQVALPPAPPPLIPMSSLAAALTQGMPEDLNQQPKSGSAASKSVKSSLSALLGPQEADKRGRAQQAAAGGQDKRAAATGASTESEAITQGQKSHKSQASGQSSSVSSSSESESGADDGAAGGRGEPEAKTKDGGRRRKMGGKIRRLHPIPLHEDGSPVLPIQIGGLKVHDLGKVVYDRAAYHSERYLLPVGFRSSRTYPSMLSPSRRTTYHCTILDGGDIPMFEMRAEDDPENPVQATSSTACQSIVLKAINKARDRQATNSGSGPEFFGYSNPTILNLLQKLPNAGRCAKYKLIKFNSPVRAAQKSKTSKRKIAAHSKQKAGKSEGPRSKKKRPTTSPKPAHTGGVVIVGGKSGAGAGGASGSGGGGASGNGGGESSGEKSGHHRRGTPTDPSLAPVLGPGMSQFGLETGMGLYSSSEEWSSSETEHELTVDM